MLKLTLTPGDADKVLEAASKAYTRVLEQAIRRGLLRIYFYPSIDALIAASYTASHAYYSGARPAVRMAVKHPMRISEPSILLGYPNIQLRTSNVEATVLAVTSGSLQGTPPPDAFFLESQGSITASMILITVKSGPRPPPNVAAVAFSGVYGGRYVTPHGAFTGLDKYLLEHLDELGLEANMTTTLKVYKPSEGSLCEAVARTVNPYYPGLTGDPEACREALGDPALYVKKASNLEKSEITKALETLLNYMESLVGELDPKLFISGIIEFRDVTPRDPRQALDALAYAAEASGDYSAPLAALLDPDIEYIPLEKALEDYAKRVASGVPKPKRLRGPGWLRIYTIEKGHPPTLAWRILTLTKTVEEDSVLAWQVSEGVYVASPLQVEEALGPGGARRLVETRVASEEGFWLKLHIEQ